jgi:predicted dinucleotide-binding enzyme
MRAFFTIGLVIMLAWISAAQAEAPPDETAREVIAVIGTGRVGGALGPRFASIGHRIVYGSRDPASEKVKALIQRSGSAASAASPAAAAAQASIIVLAVPWNAVETVVRSLGDLSGKIIMDATNPLRFGSGRSFELAVDSSGGEHVQQWAPQARVVKAFNAVGWKVMGNPGLAGGPVTIPLVGDDDKAKSRVAEIVRAIGFETADLGPIRHARHLEGMAILYLTPLMSGRPADGFEFYLRRHPAPPARAKPPPAG